MTKYFSFSGSAKRQEYWAITLLTALAGWMLWLLALIFAGIIAMVSDLLGGLLVVLITLAWVIGSGWLVIATTVRRCRDADINPLWTLLCFIPFINFWWWIIAGCLPSDDPNFIPNEKT